MKNREPIPVDSHGKIAVFSKAQNDEGRYPIYGTALFSRPSNHRHMPSPPLRKPSAKVRVRRDSLFFRSCVSRYFNPSISSDSIHQSLKFTPKATRQNDAANVLPQTFHISLHPSCKANEPPAQMHSSSRIF